MTAATTTTNTKQSQRAPTHEQSRGRREQNLVHVAHYFFTMHAFFFVQRAHKITKTFDDPTLPDTKHKRLNKW